MDRDECPSNSQPFCDLPGAKLMLSLTYFKAWPRHLHTAPPSGQSLSESAHQVPLALPTPKFREIYYEPKYKFIQVYLICLFSVNIRLKYASAGSRALLDTGLSPSSATRALTYSAAADLQEEQELSCCQKSQASSLHHHGVSISHGTKKFSPAPAWGPSQSFKNCSNVGPSCRLQFFKHCSNLSSPCRSPLPLLRPHLTLSPASEAGRAEGCEVSLVSHTYPLFGHGFLHGPHSLRALPPVQASRRRLRSRLEPAVTGTGQFTASSHTGHARSSPASFAQYRAPGGQGMGVAVSSSRVVSGRFFLLMGKTPHTLPLLQHGFPPTAGSPPQTSPAWVPSMESQVLPANLLQHGLLSPWVHRFCQEPAPVRGLHGVTASFGSIHLLQRGVLHRLQVDICSTVNLHGLQGDSLPHHGLHQGLQGNLCSATWSTSSPSFFTDLAMQGDREWGLRSVHHTLSLLLLPPHTLPLLQHGVPPTGDSPPRTSPTFTSPSPPKKKKNEEFLTKDYRLAVESCRDSVRKAKAHLELNLARDMKGSKKVFYKHVISKIKAT
ncbi:hypothetical protein QYF61_022817 [Mycteria americana]|uniref:Uncharacterized protein n=1 Tax=Mycteria americana TaxID=33587 RepID=A0AAN7PAS8_MYCAM|nr:hypothetical protein QYF61_022817 [Mycteria americana]